MPEKIKINDAKIKCSINEGIKFLKSIDLYEEQIKKNCENMEYEKKYSQEYRASIYNEEYETKYKIAMENSDYDILLKDGSFFQFNCQKNGKSFKIKYNFYQNPYIDAKISYENFIKNMYDIEYDLVGEEYRILYEQYIAESKVNQNITPIRYDFDNEEYLEMSHPISHFHIGRNNEVRLPLNYVLLPEMFIQNIVMFIYPEYWKRNIIEEEIKNYCFTGKRKSIECCNEDILNCNEKKIIYIN